MQSLPDLLHQSTYHPLLFVFMAILLGALHGLEPGHSKTMMAAFIIEIRGTVTQAVLLGLSIMISHTAVVWVVALGGQYLGRGLNTLAIEPYFQLASAALVACISAWMIWRTRREEVLQAFTFVDRGDYLESIDEIPEPHEFLVRVSLDHGGHTHDYDISFNEEAGHGHAHATDLVKNDGYMDAHELAHAKQIRRRFKDRNVTTWQIIAFGLTGGLVPCPAAITVLLLCLQLKRFILGVVLVGFFSVFIRWRPPCEVVIERA